jgi:ABC-2 type transport system permease protein
VTLARRLVLDRRRATTWWVLGVVLLIVMTVAFWPSIRGDDQFDELIRDMPDAVRAMMGAQEGIAFTSPPGYLHGRLYAMLFPLVLVVFGIGLGARAIGGSEEDGTIEPVLAQPVTRRRVALERWTAVAVLVALLAVVGLLSLLLLAPLVDLLDGIALGHVLGATVAVLALGLLHAALAFCVGCMTGRRGTAQAVAGGVAVAGYVLHGLASSADVARPARFVSPWYWYLDENLLVTAPGAVAVVLPLVLVAAAVVVGVHRFERRDLRFP